jgi:protein-S-isoprenylcysteine O-methyltransferase Ste14
MEPVLFLLQICVPVLLGAAVTAYLRSVTRRLLLRTCGTGEGAEFWLRITAVVTIAAPLVLVLIFGRNGSARYFDGADFLVNAARQTACLSLVGILGAVAALAWAMWRQIPGSSAAAPRPSAS